MSPREKRLLAFFGIAGFLILNFLAFGFYSNQRDRIRADRNLATQELQLAQIARESREQVLDQMDWLAEHEPEPAAYQDVQTTLQQLAEREAIGAGLTIRNQRPMPTESNTHFDTVKVQLTVAGTEQALYLWFDRLNIPAQLRAVTFIRLQPDRENDTLIDCTAIVEQWFVPSED
jgi:hypothetical protein